MPRQNCKDAGVCIDAESYDWPLLFGGSSDQAADTVAIDADGNLFVAGSFMTALVLNDVTLSASATADNPDAANQRWGYVAKLRPRGELLWARAFGGPTQLDVAKLAVTNDGVILAGSFVGTLEANTTTLQSEMGQDTDVFLLKMDAAGDIVWASDLVQCAGCATAATGKKEIGGIAVDEASSLYVFGRYLGHFGCDEANCTSADQEDLYFARFTGSDGARTLLNTGYLGAGRDFGRAVAYAGNDVFYVMGEFGGSMTLPGFGELTAPNAPNLFAARLDSNGTATWAVAIGGAGLDVGHDVALDGNGEPVLAGRINSAVAIPGGDALAAPSVCVLGLSGTDGAIRWGTAFPAAMQTVQQINLSAAEDGFFLAGAFNSTLGVDTVNYSSAGNDDIYLIALDENGAVKWSKGIGGIESDRALAVASRDGDAVVAGHLDSTVDFGAGAVTPTDVDAFIVRYDRAGALQ